jgi:asparagine synthase (glutamine-hydrolysing)
VSGIAGIVRFDGGPVDRELLEKMADFQAFRGPHGRGVWCDGNVGFVHTLFKLNDDDAPAPQPLTLDGKVWITAYARIDAQDELIAALRGRRRDVTKGASDAELLLHAYHAWGERCLEHVLGDFTFAIWDGRERRLFCAVDHFGIRPFYYARIGEALVFSNTLDCVRLYPRVTENLDDTAVGDFLLFGQYVDLDRTIYSDIRRIPRAHCLLAVRDSVEVKRYWEMVEEDELDDSDPRALVEEFRFRLLNATRDRLRTRRVAVFMSGGLDSTLVTASAVKALREKGEPWQITPFTTVFRELIADDEEIYARAAAEHLGLELRRQSGDDFVPFDWAGPGCWRPPEPTADPSWGHYVRGMTEVARAASLALTGWEGDEPLRAWLPGRWRRLIQTGRWARLFNDLFWYVRNEKGPPPVGARTALVRLRRLLPVTLPDWLARDFVQRAGLASRWAELRYAQARAYYAGSRPRYLECVPWAGVFDGHDAGWTGCPVGTAHPLMDLRVIDWLARVPAIPWCSDKRLFRRAALGMLPSKIVQRQKTPLSGDPTEAAFRRAPVRLPAGVQRSALRSGYVVAERLFDSNGALRTDKSLGRHTNAISFVIWVEQGHKHKMRHDGSSGEPEEKLQRAAP